MSEYLRYDHVQFRRADVLLEALQLLGWTREQIELHEEPVNLYGYHGDMRAQTAHVVIRRDDVGQSSNDLGFIRDETGAYSPIISEYDTVYLMRRFARAGVAGHETAKDVIAVLKTAYNTAVAHRIKAKLHGRMTQQVVGSTTKIIVTA